MEAVMIKQTFKGKQVVHLSFMFNLDRWEGFKLSIIHLNKPFYKIYIQWSVHVFNSSKDTNVINIFVLLVLVFICYSVKLKDNLNEAFCRVNLLLYCNWSWILNFQLQCVYCFYSAETPEAECIVH
jgi:hypothetical protein